MSRKYLGNLKCNNTRLLQWGVRIRAVARTINLVRQKICCHKDAEERSAERSGV